MELMRSGGRKRSKSIKLARMVDEEEARRSSIAKFRRGSRRNNPGFSASKDIDVASISEIRDSRIFERVEKRANVQRIILKVEEVGPGLA